MTINQKIGIRDIVKILNLSNASESYTKNIEISDLKDDLGTKGHVLVVRGDRAYADKVGEHANPKFWIYENIINSPRIQEQLEANPNHKLFDGVGFSSLEALSYHAQRLERDAVFVMAREMVPNPEIFNRYKNIEIIHGDGPAEEGYVKKQAEVLSQRDNLIPLHQALYGARALAPIGNKIASQLEEMCIVPDETFWCMASGSNLQGIGSKVKNGSDNCKTTIVEPIENFTIHPSLDLSNPQEVKDFAKHKLRNYTLNSWDGKYSEIAPLHIAHPNRYMLINWSQIGETGFDRTIRVPKTNVLETMRMLKEVNKNYNWTDTTALTLVPAIESARDGNNVLVMAYGREK